MGLRDFSGVPNEASTDAEPDAKNSNSLSCTVLELSAKEKLPLGGDSGREKRAQTLRSAITLPLLGLSARSKYQVKGLAEARLLVPTDTPGP